MNDYILKNSCRGKTKTIFLAIYMSVVELNPSAPLERITNVEERLGQNKRWKRLQYFFLPTLELITYFAYENFNSQKKPKDL